MNKNKAFTLIEVMLAMGVLTVSVFFISEIMLKSLVRLQENQDNIEKVFLIKRELYLNFFKKPLPEKKVITKIEVPKITITTTLEDVSNKSCLKDYKNVLKIMSANAVWMKDGYFKESNMISFVFRPKEKEDKK